MYKYIPIAPPLWQPISSQFYLFTSPSPCYPERSLLYNVVDRLRGMQKLTHHIEPQFSLKFSLFAHQRRTKLVIIIYFKGKFLQLENSFMHILLLHLLNEWMVEYCNLHSACLWYPFTHLSFCRARKRPLENILFISYNSCMNVWFLLVVCLLEVAFDVLVTSKNCCSYSLFWFSNTITGSYYDFRAVFSNPLSINE